VILLALFVSLAAARQPAVDRAVAITFDDLPATPAGTATNDVAGLETLTRKLLATVQRHKIPAVGFVNEGKMFVEGEGRDQVDARTRLLRLWLDAGLELGNHGYAHRDLNTLPLEQFQADVQKGEAITRPLMSAKGQRLRYFRHPFLHVGSDLATRRAFEQFLSRHGYIVAPVTIDSEEFVYAAAYAAALRDGDSASAARIADDYPRYMNEVFSYFEEVSRKTIGREIPQVLLLHANALNADRFGAIADALVKRGYRFVPLAQALEDPAYRLPDTFVGAPGNSWFSHWEITAGRKAVPTPAPPPWVGAR
jgi:peptidoglycan/xylan/chitin deacetylase (PgdA/CDA1 family)